MFTSRLLAVLVLCAAARVHGSESPGLGEPLTASDVANADFVVMPSGEGLPDGSGTAVEGARIFAAQCQVCHGENGVDGLNDNLSGGHGTLASDKPKKTVGSYWPYATTVFDYVRRAMPYQSPGTLSNDEVYALTAYLLHINGIISDSAAMNAESLPDVKMPNRDNFVWGYRPQ